MAVLRGVLLPAIAVSATLAACGGGEDAPPVVVQRPGQFQSELPGGWRVLLADGPQSDPGESDVERVPVFGAYSPDVEGLTFLVWDQAPSDIESAARAWKDESLIELSDFERYGDAGRTVLEATGRGREGGHDIFITVALVALSSADQSWALQCRVWDEADNQWCRRLIDGFGPMP